MPPPQRKQRQRRPPFLLADEPTGDLHSKAGAEVMDLLGRLNAKGRTFVMVSTAKTTPATPNAFCV